VLGVVDVLNPDQLDEVGMCFVVVESDLGQAPDRGDWVEVVELEFLFGGPDLGLGMF